MCKSAIIIKGIPNINKALNIRRNPKLFHNLGLEVGYRAGRLDSKCDEPRHLIGDVDY
jgi:hypothetical protein